MIEVAKMIYKESGILGFYRGYIPNTIRVVYKQLYRFPLMIYLPNLNQGKLSQTQTKNFKAYVGKTFAGLALGLIDVFLVNPLERIKVWLMTNHTKSKLKVFLAKSDSIVR